MSFPTRSVPLWSRTRSTAGAFAAALLAGGCGDDGQRATAGPWTSETIAAGDTTVVRTTGTSHHTGWLELAEEQTTGKVDGAGEELFSRIYDVVPIAGGGVLVFDIGLTLLREYDSTGAYVRTFGRKGAGPGEYRDSNGIAVAQNGDVLLFDGMSQRVNVFNSRGGVIDTWPVSSIPRAGARGVSIDSTGAISIRALIPDPARKGERTQSGAEYTMEVVQRFRPDGSALDTIFPPVFDQRARMLKVVLSVPGMDRRLDLYSSIPFVPAFQTTFSPHGYYVSGDGGRYSIVLHRARPPLLRIESDLPAIAVDTDERAAFEAKMRGEIERPNTSAAGSWRIPEVKPFFNSLRADADGRIWVQLHQPAIHKPAGGNASAARDASEAWIEPVVYDVFAPEGNYLGRVRLPESATFAAARGDRVWLVIRNEVDVQQLVRFRVAAWSAH